MNFLSGRNIFLILGAVKEKVQTAPEERGKVGQQTCILKLNNRKRFRLK
jgi:hypothetical protein